jgi:outer membrane protein assembly factor BamB
MKGQTTKYLKYAIGEIILVVIGILIALQINNWNENHKRQQLKSNYISSLQEDLRQDSVLVADQFNFYKADTTRLNDQIRRIKKQPSRDTLARIARYEFSTDIQLITAFNNKTYNALINTGDIALLDPWLVEDLARLDQLQKLAVSVYELSLNSYAETLLVYRERLSVYDDALAGELLDPIWDQLSYEEILKNFNMIATAKLTTSGNVLQFLPVYLEIITDLDTRIKEVYDQ